MEMRIVASLQTSFYRNNGNSGCDFTHNPSYILTMEIQCDWITDSWKARCDSVANSNHGKTVVTQSQTVNIENLLWLGYKT